MSKINGTLRCRSCGSIRNNRFPGHIRLTVYLPLINLGAGLNGYVVYRSKLLNCTNVIISLHSEAIYRRIVDAAGHPFIKEVINPEYLDVK
jgi:hypothetical protein